MDFVYFLSSYMPDGAYGGKRLYADMVEQAVAADRLGYRAVAIPEHHLINILMVSSPLQLAVKLAALTRKSNSSLRSPSCRFATCGSSRARSSKRTCYVTSALCWGSGGGRSPTRSRGSAPRSIRHRPNFVELLQVLEALLTREEVSWQGEFYNFEPLTIMPRPHSPIPLMIAAMAPDSIYDSAKRGYHIQTTPLSGGHDVLLGQVDAFQRGKADGGERSRHIRLSLQRGLYAARDEADARRSSSWPTTTTSASRTSEARG